MIDAGNAARRIAVGAGALSMAAIAGITAITLTEIAMRAAFGRSLLVTEEIVRYLMSAAVYCGLAMAFLEARMIRMTLLLDRLPERGRIRVEGAFLLLTASVAVFALLYILRGFWRLVERGTTSSGVVKFPLWIPEVPVLIGITALIAVLCLQFVSTVRALDR